LLLIYKDVKNLKIVAKYFKKSIMDSMNAEIISIGTELLLGHIVNTNTAFLSQKLAESGIDVYHTSVVGDNPQRLTAAVKQALARADIVITTGGLGPTVDDITIETIAELIGKTPIRWIKNHVGTVPGLVIDWKEKMIICLPGPPRELEPMFENAIIQCISRARLNVPYAGDGRGSWIIKSRTIKITGLAESVVNRAVKDLLELKPPTTVGIYAKLGQVELKIMSKAKNEKLALAAIGKIEKKIRAKLNNFIFGCDNETLEGAVGKILTTKRQTIAVAESCTGGLLSSRITDVSGSSKYFIMGLVAYSNPVKIAGSGVDIKIIMKYGAVSQQVARQMAKGIRTLVGADIGLAITGIAGPTGGTKRKPVGLVYIALDKKGRTPLVKEFRFKGSREEIKFQASQAALDLIRKNI